MSTHAVEQMELQILADIYPVDQINIVFFFTVTQQWLKIDILSGCY